MEFSIKSLQPGRAKSGCAVVGVFDARRLSAAAAQLDETAKGQLAAIVRRGDMEGKSGTTLLLHNLPGIDHYRVHRWIEHIILLFTEEPHSRTSHTKQSTLPTFRPRV